MITLRPFLLISELCTGYLSARHSHLSQSRSFFFGKPLEFIAKN